MMFVFVFMNLSILKPVVHEAYLPDVGVRQYVLQSLTHRVRSISFLKVVG